jgi:putative phosphoribosyl transferase
MNTENALLGVFRDRVDAATQLAELLATYCNADALVLGIPRGGVPVAAEIARRLGAELDVIVARKLGVPSEPELALGAVTANGGRYINHALVREIGMTGDFLESLITKETAEAHSQEARLRSQRPPPRIEDRTVIVVDDGLATGATMRAAVRSLRAARPSRVVVAVPVAPPQTCAALRREADEVVAVYQPQPFHAVGLYYRDFSPTQEHEVEQLLLASQRRPSNPHRPE